jgi:O-acetyl-ADP-ribose deacetylase (regulator of RNase III)
MTVSIMQGDLLDAPEVYIGHQCNCLTVGNGAGLAKLLFKRFPYADTYAHRMAPSEPGSYSLHGDGKSKRFIVNFYGQYHPGKARLSMDTKEQRLEWLISGMARFVADHQSSELALPYSIGCGLAGGDWKIYSDALETLANESKVKISLYRL